MGFFTQRRGGAERQTRGKIWILSVLFVPLWLVPSEPVKRVEVKAQRFKFTPARIRVPLGTRLEIELSSRDVVHGFEIPSAGIETKIPPRGRGSVTVVYLAEQEGRIPFRCSHKCGAGHASMRGMIIVEQKESGARNQESGREGSDPQNL